MAANNDSAKIIQLLREIKEVENNPDILEERIAGIFEKKSYFLEQKYGALGDEYVKIKKYVKALEAYEKAKQHSLRFTQKEIDYTDSNQTITKEAQKNWQKKIDTIKKLIEITQH